MDVEAKFSCAALAEDDLLFRRIRMREELGRLPEYQLDLLRVSNRKKGGKPVLEAKKILGKEATVAIKLDNDTNRYLHGLVTHFERGGATGAKRRTGRGDKAKTCCFRPETR